VPVRRRTALGIGAAALVCAGYAVYALSKVVTLRHRYGDDDRILIQALHAVAGLVLAAAFAGWAVSVLRGGRIPSERFFLARPADWSGWMLAVGVAFLGLLLAFAYDGGRTAADHYRAAPGRGVHGTLAVSSCEAQEYGFACIGTFRADDGSFTVERVGAWPAADPGRELSGWVSGPRPLAMFDGAPDGWRDDLVPLYVLGALWLVVAGFLGVVVARKLRIRPAG